MAKNRKETYATALASQDYATIYPKWTYLKNIGKDTLDDAERKIALAMEQFLFSTGRVRESKRYFTVEDGAVGVSVASQKKIFVQVSTRDPQTGHFKGAKEDEDVARIAQQIDEHLGNPEASAAAINIHQNPNVKFEHLAKLVRYVALAGGKGLLVFGGPGVGKTFTIESELNEAGVPWRKYGGKVTPARVYQLLYRNRHADSVLVFDDCDSVWNNPDMMEMFKNALNSTGKREISWESNRTKVIEYWEPEAQEKFLKNLDEELNKVSDEDEGDGYIPTKFPAKFEFFGKVIFVSNKESFDKAVTDRIAKINMTLTAAQMIARIKTLLPAIGSPEDEMSFKQEVFEVLSKTYFRTHTSEVTIRTFPKALELAKSGIEGWTDLLPYV